MPTPRGPGWPRNGPMACLSPALPRLDPRSSVPARTWPRNPRWHIFVGSNRKHVGRPPGTGRVPRGKGPARPGGYCHQLLLEPHLLEEGEEEVEKEDPQWYIGYHGHVGLLIGGKSRSYSHIPTTHTDSWAIQGTHLHRGQSKIKHWWNHNWHRYLLTKTHGNNSSGCHRKRQLVANQAR